MANLDENLLGEYLRNRRERMDPAAYGLPTGRRRTPGLRREEVAARANVSATWYTWLEQGRGGMPSTDVLDGIADALALSPVEREHLFLLAQNRPPEVRYRAPEPVSPQLQRVLDAIPYSPALVKTATWDIVAWNRAATLLLCDYAAMDPEQRNVLRLLFASERIRAKTADWESHARFAVAAFRAETARTGASERAAALVEELRGLSAEFDRFWRDHDVLGHVAGAKRFCHPLVGPITMEYSAFAVEGSTDLGLIVYTPATTDDTDRVRAVIEGNS
jgi:transcriptional regulator with XRE-family HTH domain